MPMTSPSQVLPLSDASNLTLVTGLGAVVLSCYSLMGFCMIVVGLIVASRPVNLQALAISILASAGCLAGSVFCFRKFAHYSQQTDPPVIRDDESVLVQAKILQRRAKSLQNPRFVGGSQAAAQVAIAAGAYLILNGQWSMKIEYEIDGKRYVDQGKVPSQVYYRYSKADTMPIRVESEKPWEWMPVLGPRPVSAPQLTTAPVTHRS